MKYDLYTVINTNLCAVYFASSAVRLLYLNYRVDYRVLSLIYTLLSIPIYVQSTLLLVHGALPVL